MKRFISILLVLCLVSPSALAEEEQQKSVWDSIGGWFDQAAEDTADWASQAWEDTSGWVSQAWTDASNWVEGAWGDASQWVEQAWNDSSGWVTDIWGDVSSWANETIESASGSIGAWWAQTFNTVTETSSNPWKWLADESTTFQPEDLATLSKIKEAIMSSDSDAEAKVKTIFTALLKTLKLSDEDSQKVWDTVESYANQKGISKLAATKLALPYLLQLTIDSSESQDSIPAIAIAQYLTAIIEKLSVNSTDSANALIDQLNEVLSGN